MSALYAVSTYRNKDNKIVVSFSRNAKVQVRGVIDLESYYWVADRVSDLLYSGVGVCMPAPLDVGFTYFDGPAFKKLMEVIRKCPDLMR